MRAYYRSSQYTSSKGKINWFLLRHWALSAVQLCEKYQLQSVLRQQKHLIHHKQLSEAPSNNRQYSSVTYILTQSLLDVGAMHPLPVTWPISFSIFLGVPSLSPHAPSAWFLLLKHLRGDNPKSRVTQQMCLPFGCFCVCLSISIYSTLFCYLSSGVLYFFPFCVPISTNFLS